MNAAAINTAIAHWDADNRCWVEGPRPAPADKVADLLDRAERVQVEGRSYVDRRAVEQVRNLVRRAADEHQQQLRAQALEREQLQGQLQAARAEQRRLQRELARARRGQ